MRRQFKGCKVKIYVSPVMEERIVRFCERYNMSFAEGCNVLLNANLESWEQDKGYAQGDNARPKQEKIGYSALPKTGADGKRYLK